MNKLRRSIVASCIFATISLLSFTAEAHHSTAQFDLQKSRQYAGTVSKFEWQNPHVWIWLQVPQSDGTSKEIGIECAAPGALRNIGIKWDSVKVGEKLKLTAAPLRDGRDGGLLTAIEWADGRSWVSPLTKTLIDASKNSAP